MLITNERFWSKVDKTASPNGCWLWLASRLEGYGQFGYYGKTTRLAHRISWELTEGPIPDGLFLDHLCHVRKCVNPEHLRPVTNKQNLENRSGMQSNNKSGYNGVSWNKAAGKWRAQVMCNGKKYWGGYFTDLHEAGEAARLLRNKLFTHNDLDRLPETSFIS